MNDLTYGKVLAEYNTVKDTGFWKLFIEYITRQRQCKKNDILVCRDDDFHEIRGYILGLTYILGRNDTLDSPSLAETILEDLREKHNKENE
jgi:hypothetical protein